MYTSKNFKTKKALKEAVAAYNDYIVWLGSEEALTKVHPNPKLPVTLYAPGLGQPKANGTEYVEGPHFPEPHRWYAQVEVKNGIVVGVK